LAGVLWYLRACANDQEEPVSRKQIFLRIDGTNAFVRDLELSAFTILNPEDGSSLAQLSAQYYVSDAWTVGFLASVNRGGRHTEWGSLPQRGGAILQLIRYF
jgi:hypothetical protein